MLTCELPPTGGSIKFEGKDITGFGVTQVCQLDLTKSYQVNQLFTRLMVRENITIAVLAALRGQFRFDLFRLPANIPDLTRKSRSTAKWLHRAVAYFHRDAGAPDADGHLYRHLESQVASIEHHSGAPMHPTWPADVGTAPVSAGEAP